MNTESGPRAAAAVRREASPGRRGGFPAAGLAVVLTGAFITVLDYFIANVAVPSIQAGLHASSAEAQGVIVGYGVAFTAGMVTGGRIGDLYGRRRLFTAGMALFMVTSAACGLAPSAAVLVGMRVLQGAAASLMVPQVLGIVAVMCPDEASRNRAFTVYGLVLGLAAVFGQLIGGLLITVNIAGIGWRAIFWLSVPVCAVSLSLVRRLVPESRHADGARLDVPGALLVTVTLAVLVFSLTAGQQEGWPLWSWLCLAAIAPLLAITSVYLRRMSRTDGSPVIDPGLFRERRFPAGLGALLAYFMALGSFFFLLALYLQRGHGLSPLGSGLVFFALGAGYLASSLLAPRLAGKLGQRAGLVVGPVTVAVGYVLAAVAVTATPVTGPVGWLVPPLVVAGSGMGLTTGPLTSTVLAGAAPDHAASASGAANTAQEGGAAIGVAIVGTVFFPALGRHSGHAAYPHAFATGLIPLITFCLLSAVLIRLMGGTSR